LSNFDEFNNDYELLQESYNRMAEVMLSIEDDGWTLLGLENPHSSSFSLEMLHALSERLTEKTDGNPLLKRGLGLRTSYIFGRGVDIQDVSSKRVQDLIDDAQNQAALFSNDAMCVNERSNFTSGQFFILGDNSTKKLQRLPFNEITGWVTDPDDAETVRYIRRSWTRKAIDGKDEAKHEWYPVDTYSNPTRVAYIQKQPVNYAKTIFPFVVNKRSGAAWGVPDAFSAYPWAHAYNEYLKDGSRILKALSMFAWQLKSKSKTGASAAAATIATPSSSGSTAIMGADMELSALPRTSNSVDLGNGKPLAAMVASALEVSVIALMSDPGTSGAYGVAQTLDVPTTKAMQARQKLWENYLKRVMAFFGDKKATIKWPKMETESSFRQLQSLALAKESMAIWPDEFRAAVLDELDVVALRSASPEDSVESEPANSNNGSAVPSQGNSGAVGSMQDNSNELRDMDGNA
jgi:hypothetical protein